ncbi:bifunctional 2-polyprenyl-6-hydroxyphenol methylase/3-demethylubiquinol 3-O-methyltransferase UbiG [Nocardiopsis sp. NRRL B-16309]|uniref:class I SAM-dependent methyltransferase n=1 Tax=Nocardiopsis sp. NRRL B-16309 TaxID=1519494 RepID=UPI0006C16BD0|nr:class I SAM-dependent methyltransferase [Nocardiopsis sp. NRRL B-16309]KOX11201.1 methyltransferase type 11 [Nocardiopsis sp. NRRL B-16309]
MNRFLPQSPIDVSWDHNSHYHDHLLRRIPAQRATAHPSPSSAPRGRCAGGGGAPSSADALRTRSALDVGCGDGRFARRLAERGLEVDAVDASADMIALARARTPTRLPVRYQAAPLAEAELDPAGYAFVSAIASLHHMPFGPALEHLAGALAPGGTLAVLGLYREEDAADLAASLAALGPQWAIGLGLRAGRFLTGTPEVGTGETSANPMPMREPEMGLREIRATAAEVLPGSRVRRLLMWRYSLFHTRPV